MKSFLRKAVINLLIIAAVLVPAVVLAAIINTLPFTLQNGTTADATQVMADFNQIVNNVNANAAKNGVNADITALTALSTPISQAAGGTNWWVGGTSTGTPNAQVLATLVPASFSLTSGNHIVFIAGATNTGATTLNANGQGAVSILKRNPNGAASTFATLTGGELVSGAITEVVYDGTQFEINTNNLTLAGQLTNIASAATTDLGTAQTHNVNITGTTTITAFGSSASVVYPFYYVTFAGALTLTYNASSLILPSTANITTAANDTAVAMYLGSGNWQLVSYTRASGAALGGSSASNCGAWGFLLTNDAGTPNTSLDMSASQATMTNSSNVPATVSSPSVVVNTTINGANGLDTGSKAVSSWYNFYLIYNGTTTAGLASLSATSPTLPSGYTFFCRLGAMRTDGSGNFFRTRQLGNIAQYQIVAASNTLVTPVVSTGVVGTASTTAPTLTAITVRGGGTNPVPPTATAIQISAKGSNGTTTMEVAPNTAWGGANNGPQGTNNMGWPIWSNASSSASAWLLLEGNTVAYACADAGCALSIAAWKDNTNAN